MKKRRSIAVFMSFILIMNLIFWGLGLQGQHTKAEETGYLTYLEVQDENWAFNIYQDETGTVTGNGLTDISSLRINGNGEYTLTVSNVWDCGRFAKASIVVVAGAEKSDLDITVKQIKMGDTLLEGETIIQPQKSVEGTSSKYSLDKEQLGSGYQKLEITFTISGLGEENSTPEETPPTDVTGYLSYLEVQDENWAFNIYKDETGNITGNGVSKDSSVRISEDGQYILKASTAWDCGVFAKANIVVTNSSQINNLQIVVNQVKAGDTVLEGEAIQQPEAKTEGSNRKFELDKVQLGSGYQQLVITFTVSGIDNQETDPLVPPTNLLPKYGTTWSQIFENGEEATEWGTSVNEIVDNPNRSFTNSSSKVLHTMYSETWGRSAVFGMEFNPASQVIRVKALSNTKSTLSAFLVIDDVTYEATATLKGTGEWFNYQFSFDNVPEGKIANGILLYSGTVNKDIWWDDIEIVNKEDILALDKKVNAFEAIDYANTTAMVNQIGASEIPVVNKEDIATSVLKVTFRENTEEVVIQLPDIITTKIWGIGVKVLASQAGQLSAVLMNDSDNAEPFTLERLIAKENNPFLSKTVNSTQEWVWVYFDFSSQGDANELYSKLKLSYSVSGAELYIGQVACIDLASIPVEKSNSNTDNGGNNTISNSSESSTYKLSYDFESIPTTYDWGMKSKDIINNPFVDENNTSSRVMHGIYTESWGRIAFPCIQFNPATQAVRLKAYSSSMGDINLYMLDENSSNEIVATDTILEKNKWGTYYFDFSESAKLDRYYNMHLNFSILGTDIYFDDLEIINLNEVPKEEYQTLEYEYDSMSIGGGGFVAGIISCPTKKNLYYARTDVGGAYRYDAKSKSWVALNYGISEEDRGYLSVESLAVDQNSPNKLYLLVGCQYFSEQRTAVLYSEDYGESFTEVDVTNLIYVHGNGYGRQNGERLAIDPNNSNILYCGGRTGGLIKSTDSGRTWKKVENFPAFTNTVNWPTWTENKAVTTQNQNGIVSVVFDDSAVNQGATARIFVGISQSGTENVYMTEDGGITWTAVKGLPTKWMPQRMKMDTDGNLLITYADTEGPGGSSEGGIYRYEVKNNKVVDISPDNKPFGDVTFDPNNSKRLVCTTISTWEQQPWGHGDLIFTSTDGGKTWRNLWEEGMTISANGCSWIKNYATIHWSGSLVLDPYNAKHIFVTSGNGIFACDNIWAKKPKMYFGAKGLEETVPMDMISIPGKTTASVILDYDGFTHNSPEEYAQVHSTKAGSHTSIAYAGKKTDFWVKAGGYKDECKFFYSVNGGKTWKLISGEPKTNNNEHAYEGSTTVTADAKVILWSPANTDKTYRTTNKGKTWTECKGIGGNLYIAADYQNEKYVYASDGTSLYISSDKGKSFKKADISVPVLKRITVDPLNAGRLYIPLGESGLAYSTDYGKTFTVFDKVTKCSAVGVGIGKTKKDPLVIYVWGKANGDALGLYRSEDMGKTWYRINDKNSQFGGPGNGQFVVGDMNVYGRVYMSSVGLGIIYGEPKTQEVK